MPRAKKDQKVVITGLSMKVDGKEFITGTTVTMTTGTDIRGHRNAIVQQSSALMKAVIDMLSWNPLEAIITKKGRSEPRIVKTDELLRKDKDECGSDATAGKA